MHLVTLEEAFTRGSWTCFSALVSCAVVHLPGLATELSKAGTLPTNCLPPNDFCTAQDLPASLQEKSRLFLV